MTICPIALAVHCKGCPLVKFCPAKSLLGDFDTYLDEADDAVPDTSDIKCDTEES